jgi:hypothetical protein
VQLGAEVPVIERGPDGAVAGVCQHHRDVVAEKSRRRDRPGREPALTALNGEESFPRRDEKAVAHLFLKTWSQLTVKKRKPRIDTDEHG